MTDFRKSGGEILRIIQSSTDPAAEAGNAIVYAKDSGGTTKVFMRDSAGAVTEVGAGGGGGTAIPPSGVSVYHSTTQSATTSTWLLLTYDTEEFDTNSFHSTVTNPSRLTAPTTGYYYIRAGVLWANNSTGSRHLAICKNAAGVIGGTTVAYVSQPAVSGFETQTSASAVAYLTAGDYLEVFGYQNSGSTLLISKTEAHRFQMMLLNATVAPPSLVSVYDSTTQSTATATYTTLTYDTEEYDTASFHSTSLNTSRLTAPVTGYYRITSNVQFAANSSGYRIAELYKNGTTRIGIVVSPPVNGDATSLNLSIDAYLVAGDYVENRAWQSSGGNLLVTKSASVPFQMMLLQGGGAAGGMFGSSMSTVPTAASTGFSSWWHQFAGATYTDGEQGPLIVLPTGGTGVWSARAKAVPATPYTITMLIAATFPLCANATGAAFVGWAETATGAANKADLCATFPNQSVQTYRYQLNNATSINNQSFLGSTIRYWPEYYWFRLTDDGTTVTVGVSATGDSSSFMTIMTQTKAGSFLGLAAGYNYILFGATCATPGSVQLLSYKLT